jgi:hypothetical protein
MLEIVDIGFTLDFTTFHNVVDEVISDESSRTGIGFDWSDKEAHLSKSNKNVYKITFTNLDSSNTIDLVASKVASGIEFEPIELRNYNNTFYKWNYEDDDLMQVMLLALKKSALKAKGNFGCIFDGQYTLVKDGRDMSTHVAGLAIIDDRGKVYHLKHGQNLDEEDDDNTMGYVPRYLINDWLDENPQFQAKLQTIPKIDQFEMMAQFAVYQKRKNMLTADQFRDVLLQVGTFAEMIGGFKDESIKSIYQFFV